MKEASRALNIFSYLMSVAFALSCALSLCCASVLSVLMFKAQDVHYGSSLRKG